MVPATSDRSNASPEPGLWIVVPAYNEAAHLETTLVSLTARFANIVVIDDGSTDDTWQLARRHPVWVIRHPFNCGQGAAIQSGLDFALARQADVIVTFDADGQHSADDIQRLVQPILRGEADVVLGSRFLGRAIDMPRSRWIVLKMGVLFTRLTARIHVTDTHNGLRALSRHAARRIRISQHGMAHASEILQQVRACGFRWCEVPVTVRYFAASVAKGQSSWNSVRIVARLLMGRMVR